jgi:hypothetical protein
MMMQRDAVSDLELFHAPSDSNDSSGRFVAEYARWRHGAIMDFFYIGRAHATDCNFDEQFARPDFGHGQRLDAQVIRAAINHRLHRLGNIEHTSFLTTD